MNKLTTLSTSTLKVVDFDDDNLAGVVVLSNKILKTMAVYNVVFDCVRKS